MIENTLEQETRSWHLSKTVSLTFIAGIIIALVQGTWNTAFIIRTVDTTPPLPEQVQRIRWEVEQNKVLIDQLAALNKKQDAHNASVYALMRAFTTEVNNVKVDIKVNETNIKAIKESGHK